MMRVFANEQSLCTWKVVAAFDYASVLPLLPGAEGRFGPRLPSPGTTTMAISPPNRESWRIIIGLKSAGNGRGYVISLPGRVR